MNWWRNGRRKSARAIIISDGKLLAFLRKRYSRKTGEWIEYYSIPGGGIDKNESPEQAAERELYEEMGVRVRLGRLVAHQVSKHFEHYVFTAEIVDGEPDLVSDSEEAKLMNEHNQFIVQWVPVDELTKENLRYYCGYLELIQQLAAGNEPREVLRIDMR
jgi:8-oxo-dGTP pyrophosphatase MutT (NUDIX family)